MQNSQPICEFFHKLFFILANLLFETSDHCSNFIVHDGVVIIDRFCLLRWHCVLGKSLFLANFFLRLLVQLVDLVERLVVLLDEFLG